MSNNKGSPYTYESVLHGWPILAASALVVGFLVIKKRSDADHRNNRILQENTQLKAEIEQLNQKLENSREQINQHSSLIEVQAQKILNLQKIESELQALKKRESEWQNLQSQLNSEVKRLKEENSRNLSKCTTLAEECDKLKLVLASAESSNQQKESKLKELQQNFELQRSQQLKTSQQESEQLNRTISTLEEKVKEYQLQIEEQRKKLQDKKSDASSESEDQQSPRSDEEPPAYTKKKVTATDEDQMPPPYSLKTQQVTKEETSSPPPSKEPEVTTQDITKELDIPDDIMQFVKPSPQSAPAEEENTFDIGKYKKTSTNDLPKGFGRKSSRKTFDLSALKEEFTSPQQPQQQQPAQQTDDFKLPDDTDLLANLTKKTKTKQPAFMSIFSKPDEEVVASPQPLVKTIWHPGDAIVRDYAVKEDVNSKGAKKAKKKVGFGPGSTNKGPEMEDQHYIEVPFANDSTKALFCIFDGHGGKDCAIAAKKTFSSVLQQHLTTASEDLCADLTRTFLAVDQELLEYEYMGCTATCVFVWQLGEKRYVQAANVGDSTAFLKRGSEVIWLTRDHKASSEEERERIRASGAELTSGQTRVSGGLAVSRALGDHFLKQEKVGLIGEPYVSPSFQLGEEDTIVILASDGLWDVMTGEEAMKVVESLDTAEAMAKRLINTALQNPKCTDNITVMVLVL